MKSKIFLLLAFSWISSTQLFAQDYFAGGGLGYGSQINTLGINFRAVVQIDQQWSITPHYNLFFNKNHGLVTDKWRAFNLDLHYFFPIDLGWDFYPLAGFNLATVSSKVSSITFSNTYGGFNMGIGTKYDFSEKMQGFSEIKYVISSADQLVFLMGACYRISN